MFGCGDLTHHSGKFGKQQQKQQNHQQQQQQKQQQKQEDPEQQKDQQQLQQHQQKQQGGTDSDMEVAEMPTQWSSSLKSEKEEETEENTLRKKSRLDEAGRRGKLTKPGPNLSLHCQ